MPRAIRGPGTPWVSRGYGDGAIGGPGTPWVSRGYGDGTVRGQGARGYGDGTVRGQGARGYDGGGGVHGQGTCCELGCRCRSSAE